MNNEELDKLRVQWQRWNKQCHPEDRIDWIEFLEEATRKINPGMYIDDDEWEDEMGRGKTKD